MEKFTICSHHRKLKNKFGDSKMTSFFTKIADQYRTAMQQFTSYGYLEYYKFLYGTSQFPYWFLIQAVFSCYVVNKTIENIRKTKLLYAQQLLTAFLMTFMPREIFAHMFKKLSPIKHNPQSIIIFLGIYSLMCIPQIYKIINFFAKIVGMGQGVNIARFFTLALRNIKGIPVQLILPASVIFSVMDQLINLLFRTVYKQKDAEICNKNTILRASIINTIFWLFTHRNYFTQYIGIHSLHFSALILALALSTSNSTYSVFIQDNEGQQPQQNTEDENDVVSENMRLKQLIIQIQEKNKKDINELNEEIDRLKLQLFETQQKAKEDHDRLTDEIQHLKKD